MDSNRPKASTRVVVRVDQGQIPASWFSPYRFLFVLIMFLLTGLRSRTIHLRSGETASRILGD